MEVGRNYSSMRHKDEKVAEEGLLDSGPPCVKE